jgi:hypothetical protein
MTEDGVEIQAKEFLLALPDDELEWLATACKGTLTSDASLKLLGDYLQVAEGSPRARWAERFGDQQKGDFELLVRRIQKDVAAQNEAEEQRRADTIAPFEAELRQLISQKAASLDVNTPDDELVKKARLEKLTAGLRAFVLEHARAPTSGELDELWAVIKRERIAVWKWGRLLRYL